MRALDNKNDLGNLKKRKHLRGQAAWQSGTHLFELERGGEMTGETKAMTGRAALSLNLTMQQDFCAAVKRARETGVERTERLGRWACKEHHIEERDESE